MRPTRLVIAILLALGACSFRRSETAGYPSSQLPRWILDEWRRAQDEILELDGLPQDPRRFPANEWRWYQVDEPFYLYEGSIGMMKLEGATNTDLGFIIVCCGSGEVVRHEAFHAILWRMGDPRHWLEYEDLRAKKGHR